jgi:hypothetical protein
VEFEKNIKKKAQNSCEKRNDTLDLQPQNKTRSYELGELPERPKGHVC